MVLIAWTALPMLSACSADGDAAASYRDLRAPEERLASEEAVRRGRALYLRHCALCHGTDADGCGVRRSGLSSRPTDFTSRTWQRGASAAEVFVTIREGVRGTPMPAWKTLSEEETWDIVAYLLSLARSSKSGLGSP